MAESSLQLKVCLNSLKLESGQSRDISRLGEDRPEPWFAASRTNFVAAPLSPGDKELLVWCEAVNRRSGMLLLSLFESKVSNLGACQVANALTQNKLSIVVDTELGEVTIELPLTVNASGYFSRLGLRW